MSGEKGLSLVVKSSAGRGDRARFVGGALFSRLAQIGP